MPAGGDVGDPGLQRQRIVVEGQVLVAVGVDLADEAEADDADAIGFQGESPCTPYAALPRSHRWRGLVVDRHLLTVMKDRHPRGLDHQLVNIAVGRRGQNAAGVNVVQHGLAFGQSGRFGQPGTGRIDRRAPSTIASIES